mmetsp:Transcript_68808/g.185409  ORF Transcript_68808/g.185409 Transcript_68808/m.185409 type:complete len:209 (+) Transcript_68808:251-877(+)
MLRPLGPSSATKQCLRCRGEASVRLPALHASATSNSGRDKLQAPSAESRRRDPSSAKSCREKASLPPPQASGQLGVAGRTSAVALPWPNTAHPARASKKSGGLLSISCTSGFSFQSLRTRVMKTWTVLQIQRKHITIVPVLKADHGISPGISTFSETLEGGIGVKVVDPLRWGAEFSIMVSRGMASWPPKLELSDAAGPCPDPDNPIP